MIKRLNNVEPRLIPASEIESLREQGYELFAGGDAAQANSDYFMVMINRKKNPPHVAIVCPTFLRGPIGICEGQISY